MDIYTLPDIANPTRKHCILNGCSNLQRNRGNKRWGKYCDSHYNHPAVRMLRFAKREHRDKERAEERCAVASRKRRARVLAKANKSLEYQICRDCGIRQPRRSFPSGDYICTDCHSIRSRSRWLMKEYGIGVVDYNTLFASQNGCCAICGRHQAEFDRRLAVDHDHDTGKVRGLLCTRCNLIVGYAETDEIDLAMAYIKMHKE